MHESVDGCIVSGTLSLVLRMSRVYGVAPVRFIKVRDGWRMRTSISAYVYQIGIVILLCAYTVVLIVKSFFLPSFERMNTMFVSRFTSVLSVLLVLAAHAYAGVPRMKTVICCLQQLQKINTEMDKYAPRTAFEKKARYMTMYVVISAHIAAAIDTAILGRANVLQHRALPEFLTDTVLLLVHNLKTIIAQLLVLQICLILGYALCSFCHLNNCFNKLVERACSEYRIKTSSQEASETISKIGYLYCSLHRVAQVLGQCYEIVFVPLLLFFTMHLIRALFILIHKLISGIVVIELGLMQFIWASQYFGDMLMIVEPCHRSWQQIKRTKLLLSQMIYHAQPTDLKLKAELDLFYKHLMTNGLLFVPMEICELNRAVFLSVFGTIVTYLVIALQFNPNG